MIFNRMFGRARRLWLLGIVALLAITTLLRTFGDGLVDLTSPTCAEPPSFRTDVPTTVRAELSYLFDNGLLYCETPQRPFRGMDGPVYWGSEGTTSVLFFQAESLRGVGVVGYGFGRPGQLFDVTPAGGAPVSSYGEQRRGAMAIRNESEVEAPQHFVFHGGAPLSSDMMATARIRGPNPPREGGIGSRDAVRDITGLWDRLRGRTPRSASFTTESEVFFSIVPSRWAILVKEDVNPLLAQGDEATIPAALQRAKEEGAIEGPAWYKTVSGDLASAVWAADVATDTRPALLLRDGSGAELEPDRVVLFESSLTGLPLALFPFAPQPVDTPFEASLWLDEDARTDGAPADLTFPVTFP